MTASLAIETLDQKTAFLPGDAIDGVISWAFDDEPREIELRLLWYSSGKGNRDTGVVEVVRYEQPARDDVKTFGFIAPAGPFSYSGTLITLSWALEATVRKEKKTFARLDLVIAPNGREVTPPPLPEQE